MKDGSGLLSQNDWRRRRIRYGMGTAQFLLLVGLIIVGLGPILWLAKSAITPTNDTISHPMALFPHGVAWGKIGRAHV